MRVVPPKDRVKSSLVSGPDALLQLPIAGVAGVQ
jgi:hypothetical protein